MAVEPITREEMYLAKAGGAENAVPKPITRREMFLAKAAGEDVETPTPITREEMFLSKVSGGGGSGGSGGEGVKTCNVTFKQSEWSFGPPEITYYACSRLVNGKVETVFEGDVYGDDDPVAVLEADKPFTLENVVCGTLLIFLFSFAGNGHDVVFDENYVRCLNDDFEYGYWAISPDATDFDFEISKIM